MRSARAPTVIRFSFAPKKSANWVPYSGRLWIRGIGISASDLEQIAAGHAPSRSVGGLGLLICRQLAAAHFSRLRVESRVGTGTAVSFITPTGGPSSIAPNWSRWMASLMHQSGPMIEDGAQSVHRILPRAQTEYYGKNHASPQNSHRHAGPRD